MLPQLIVRIPESAWPSIGRLLETPREELARLADCLAAAKPRADVEDLAESCSERSGIPADTVEHVLTIAINTAPLAHDLEQGTDETLRAVARALQRDEYPDWHDHASQAWEERLPLLQRITECNAVQTMAKARRLLYEFQSVLRESVVITDVRPVYDDTGAAILGSLVAHTLGLTYAEGSETREVRVALTPKDLVCLLGQLQRAQRKAETAQDWLDKQDVPELTPRRNLP